MTELEEGHEMIQAYEHYNQGRRDARGHKVKVSEKMGYRGDVEQTRINLEKIFTISAGITTTV